MTSRAPTLSVDFARVIASWTEQDPDPQTRQQVDDLLTAADSGDARARAELVDAFSSRLQFGTAGLRGALGPGPNRMNRVVVGQAAAGLATYLLDHGLAGGKVIIGFDARYNSDVFARDTAEIISGAGFQTMITPGPLPTPVVAFGIRHFGCVAGVVVTASHNPPQDNGYKVYLGDGSQIVPPADVEISSRIEEVAKHSLYDVPRSQSYAVLGEELLTAYLARIASLVPRNAPRDVRWVYTPLHGVGGSLVERAVEACGFPQCPRGCRAGRPRSEVPDSGISESRGTWCHRSRSGTGTGDQCRSGDRERPGCRPLRNSRSRRRGVADAEWRRARCAAWRGHTAARRPRYLRMLNRFQLPALGHGGGVRPTFRLHLDRVQVDRAGTWPGVRL